jgi:hypothetical protein
MLLVRITNPSHSTSAVDTPPYPHANDNTTIIEMDTTSQSTLLSVNPNPPATACLPLSHSCMLDLLSDDRTAMNHIPLSRCSTGPEPEIESFTNVFVANGKYHPAIRHITSTSKLTRIGLSGPQPAVALSVSPRVQEQKS